MASDPKNENPPPVVQAQTFHRVRIFTYPKIIFIMPTMIAALICGIGMTIIHDQTQDPTKAPAVLEAREKSAEGTPTGKAADGTTTPATAKVRRFNSPQNVLGMVFLSIFALNMLVMAIDFPRFTVIAIILLAAALGFFLLWLNVYFDLLPPIVALLESIYVVANAGFYFLFATIILVIFAIIWVTRYLDYWEILPNEILHNHGPFSDLERFPTFNLKFDKEIPDILEYALLRSGRLVLHVANERRAIVLDNVLWIDAKEDELKKLMSRMEVRVTTDQEAAEPI
ncbi:MAG: hypothetical protein IRY99_21980 [Isosphaeraceae bacterium]|nr:hypothetical protein [Isosphaeraceae bacterium]